MQVYRFLTNVVVHYRKNLELREVVISGNQLLSSLEEGFLPLHLSLTGAALQSRQSFPISMLSSNLSIQKIIKIQYRSFQRQILGQKHDKRLKTIALCQSQFLQLADFTEKHGFNNPYKKVWETRKLESVYEKHFQKGKTRVENQAKLELKRHEFMPSNLD